MASPSIKPPKLPATSTPCCSIQTRRVDPLGARGCWATPRAGNAYW